MSAYGLALVGADTAYAGLAVEASQAKSLRLDRVGKRYGKVVAVDDVSLTVPRGQFLTLLGPSGSGKTTLLMMIAGFVQPSAGSIFVDERMITHLPPERRNCGVVFQGYALFPHMTVAQNIAYPLRIRGIGRAAIEQRVRAVMSLVQLDGFADRQPRQLSGGQQQRVAIARAIVFDPDILLFDEPLGALDRKLRAEVQVELKALHERLGATFLYVTHDQEEALAMSDRVAVTEAGRVVQDGTPAELYEYPKTRFVADFLGRSNFIVGLIEGRADDAWLIRVGGCLIRHTGTLPSGAEREVTLALRPEKLQLRITEPVEFDNHILGRIRSIAYQGATLEVVLDTSDLGAVAATLFASGIGALLTHEMRVWIGWSAAATVALAT